METRQPRCPRCGYEYESWVEVCPDCGTILESQPQSDTARTKLDPHKDPRWTIVTNVPNAILGNFIKSQLEDVGIPVIMMRSRSADIAEFSHNDFVPQDLRVPLDYLREARSIIDSEPGDSFGSNFPPFSEVEEGEESTGEVYTHAPGVPEGWTLLPTERDLSARQEVRRSHGEASNDWYWSDRGEPQEYEREPETYHASQVYRVPDKYQMDYSYGPTRWVRVIYGLLLLALSLPFLIQVVSQLWQMASKIP